MATTVPAPWMPLVWWTAPETPRPMYRRGEMVSPVWPIWALRSIQPSSQATRVAPTAAPSGSARERTRSKSPSTPRPPTTTVRASVRAGPEATEVASRETRRTAVASALTGTSRGSAVSGAPSAAETSAIPGRTAMIGALPAEPTETVVDQEPDRTSLEARSTESSPAPPASRAVASETQAESSRTAARPASSLPR